jgi:hypothetical protein
MNLYSSMEEMTGRRKLKREQLQKEIEKVCYIVKIYSLLCQVHASTKEKIERATKDMHQQQYDVAMNRTAAAFVSLLFLLATFGTYLFTVPMNFVRDVTLRS